MNPKNSKTENSGYAFILLLLVALLLLSFALRLYRVGDSSVWWDEGMSVWHARQSLAEIAQQISHNVHPPLYFWLLHGWLGISGDSEFGLRTLSVYLGTLAVAGTVLLGRTVAGNKAGLLAALFLAISRFHIIWSQEIRFYALATLLAVLAAWAAIRVWNRGRWQDYALYVLFATAGLYTLYLFFPVPVAINIAWIWVFWRSRRRRQELIRWGAAQLTILGLLAIWLIYALTGFLTNSSATPIATVDFLKIYWTVLVMGIPLRVEQYALYTMPVLIIFLGALALLIWQARRDWRMARNITLLLAGLLIPIAVVFYVTIPKVGAYAPPFSPRYLVIFTGYYSILLAWGILLFGQKRRWPLAVLLTLVVLFSSWAGLRSYHQGRVLLDDFKSIGAQLEAYVQPGDAVVLYSDRDWPIFDYHYPEEWFGVPNNWDVTPEVAESYLRPIWEEHDGLWLVSTQYAVETDPQGNMPAWLEREALATTESIHGDKALQFFARTPERAQTIGLLSESAGPQFNTELMTEAGIRLVGFDLPSRTYHGGDSVYLGTYWASPAGAADGQSGSQIAMSDEAGTVLPWSIRDLDLQELSAGSSLVRKEVVIQIPYELPSGNYSLVLAGENGGPPAFAQLEIRQRNRPFLSLADVNIATPLNVQFENGIQLLGYEIENDELAPGDELDLTLYWQTPEPVTRNFKVFTHLLGEVYHAESENFIWAQQDNEPVNNKRPTTTWRRAEVIVDPYELRLPDNTPAGSYSLEIGLYEAIGGRRLLLLDESGTAVSDHFILAEIDVR